jgi:hypothetical protein
LASLLVSGLVSHTPVKMPMVCVSPFFSARYAAATTPPPPGLFTTCARTGSSFSFSIMLAMARASTSLPPPGPVCTTSSIGRVGVKPWANAVDDASNTAHSRCFFIHPPRLI